MNEAYITKIEKFLPNQPVENHEMEQYLGLINEKESKSKSLVLRSNRIKLRYYALDKNGNSTHSNSELAAEAIKKLTDEEFGLKDIELLTAGTSSPDVIQPSHALQVHGVLGNKPMEVMASHGTCNAGMLSLKYSWMAILSGLVTNSVATASEKLSSWMHARNFKSEIDKRKELENNPYIAFEKDFLRWMLSDGAAAMLVKNKPSANGLSLKIEWIEVRSYANQLKACMYAGCDTDENGNLTGWREFPGEVQLEKSVFSLRQNVKLLQNNIVRLGVDFTVELFKKYNIEPDTISYLLPHLSSMFFYKPIIDEFENRGFKIPEEKVFTNLTRVGNVGAASPFLMLEELFNSGKLKAGDKILLMVPESARFSYSIALFTAV